MTFYPRNAVATSLTSGVTSGDTDLPVDDGSTYPDPAAPGYGPYKVIVGFETSREEVCWVTAKPSANVLRVTRGYDSSSATAKNSGDVIVVGVSGGDFEAMNSKLPLAGGTMTGELLLAADPTEDLGAATKQYVDDAMPLGAIIAYGAATAPAGWHLCNGTAHGSTALQGLIGSANTPDLRDRFIVGAGSTYAIGATGGSASVTLTSAQSGIATHTHTVTLTADSSTHTHSVNPPATDTSSATPTITVKGGAGTATGEETGAEIAGGGVVYITDGSGDGAGGAAVTATQAAHDHSVDIASFTSGSASTGHNHTATAANAGPSTAAEAHENRPPYYALTYIIKKV